MPKVSIVIPCLNEAGTLIACISKAMQALSNAGMEPAQVVVADNGSTDGSQQLAREAGATVIDVAVRGYGAALHAGIMAAEGEWVLFADADESYDFLELEKFIPLMKESNDLVVGNRFAGNIEKGAMPFLHRYLGTPVLSFIGRKAFKVSLSDFNCGIRAIKKAAYMQLHMQAPGMEYASEMIARAGLLKMNIAEVPVSLRKDKRNRKPHLQTWRDGWKHLRLMLLMSPQWLLLAPAISFLLAGLLLSSLLVFNYIKVFNLVLDIHTLYYASIFIIVGIQLLQFYVVARLFGSKLGFHPPSTFSQKIVRYLNFESGLMMGGSIFLIGVMLSLYAVRQWSQVQFGPLDPTYVFRIIIPAGFCIATGMQLIVFGFLIHTIAQWQPRSL